jgi:hypothetical protein
MSNILPFPSITPDMRIGYIAAAIDTRRTRREYLDLAKKSLTKNDYEGLLLAIMDPEYYGNSDDLIRKAADDYYDLPNSRME